MVCGKEAQYSWDNCQISQSDCTAEILEVQKELYNIHHTPFPLGLLRGDLGTRLLVGMYRALFKAGTFIADDATLL